MLSDSTTVTDAELAAALARSAGDRLLAVQNFIITQESRFRR